MDFLEFALLAHYFANIYSDKLETFVEMPECSSGLSFLYEVDSNSITTVAIFDHESGEKKLVFVAKYGKLVNEIREYFEVIKCEEGDWARRMDYVLQNEETIKKNFREVISYKALFRQAVEISRKGGRYPFPDKPDCLKENPRQ